jgi:hypothetical protein
VRVRRVVAAVAVVGLVASGCSSEPASGELELQGDDATAAPVEPDPPVEVTDEPSDPPEDDEQLYPPLPPLEPDPESDVPIDAQAAALALHARVYNVTQLALRTGEYDRSELEELLTGDLLESFVSTLEERSEGHVSLSPDTTISWLRVVEAGSGPVVVQECRVIGPETGVYDGEGQRVSPQRTDYEALIFQTTYALVEVHDGSFDYRAVEAGSATDTSLCDA